MSLNEQQIGRRKMELQVEDLLMTQKVMGKLEEIAAFDGMGAVEVRFHLTGGDEITVGYGESGTPAILRIDPA